MCGIAGFARQPGASTPAACVKAVEKMLLMMEHRGKHATGFATLDIEGGVEVFKRAVEVKVAVESQPWKDAVKEIDDGTTVMMGHVRHSTHSRNKDKDFAAHPFTEGKVVGVHNGVIDNWKQIEKQLGFNKRPLTERWDVDSQAAFGALSKHKNPATALAMLEGWFVLTWLKNGHLFMTKSPMTTLATAYIPQYRTLLWCSESKILEAVLNSTLETGTEYHTVEMADARLYQYDTAKFSAEGTGVIRTEVTLKNNDWFSDKRWGKTQGAKAKAVDVTKHQMQEPNSFVHQGQANHLWDALARLQKRLSDTEAQVKNLEYQNESYRLTFEEMGWKFEDEVDDSDQYPLMDDPSDVCEMCGVGPLTGDRLVEASNNGLIHLGCAERKAKSTVLVRSDISGEWVTHATREKENASNQGRIYA